MRTGCVGGHLEQQIQLQLLQQCKSWLVGSMPVWYDEPTIANRLGHPFVHPGGPSVVAEPAAARRQTVQQFHEQATAAWSQLAAKVQEGLQEQEERSIQAAMQQDLQQHGMTQQQQQPQQLLLQQQQQQQQQQQGLDLSGIAVPVLPRRRLTGPVLLVPQPEYTPLGMTPQQAAAAAVAAARATLPPEDDLMETLLVPAGCLQLRSWQESAAAEEPPGEVATTIQLPRTTAAAAAAAAARDSGGGGGGVGTAVAGDDDLLQPGSEVVVTMAVMDTGRLLNVVQQEIQALGSNTLADIRDAIVCPTDKLAEGLGASNPAAYFYLDKCFYDDTRAAVASECSQVVKHWAHRLGTAGPKHLLQHYELPEELPAQMPLSSQQQQQQQHVADGLAGIAQQQQQQQELQQQQQLVTLEQQPPPEQQQQQQQLLPLEQQRQGSAREMQHVRLLDLVLQASNRPMAIYSHQGLCEHAVVITDVRLLHAADANHRSAYPRTVYQQALGKRLHCGVCKRVGATALVLDHPEAPEAVIVLCRLCCGLFSVEQYPEAKLIMLEPFKL